jgi:hypothetical protein
VSFLVLAPFEGSGGMLVVLRARGARMARMTRVEIYAAVRRNAGLVNRPRFGRDSSGASCDFLPR